MYERFALYVNCFWGEIMDQILPPVMYYHKNFCYKHNEYMYLYIY